MRFMSPGCRTCHCSRGNMSICCTATYACHGLLRLPSPTMRCLGYIPGMLIHAHDGHKYLFDVRYNINAPNLVRSLDCRIQGCLSARPRSLTLTRPSLWSRRLIGKDVCRQIKKLSARSCPDWKARKRTLYLMTSLQHVLMPTRR